MPLSEPGWWYPDTQDQRSWPARLLRPLAAIYAWAANRRMLKREELTADCPVICVGNFTAGGAGKTPLVSWIATYLAQQGLTPVVLSRGFGGQAKGPVWVDVAAHTAVEVGDEPLLLAQSVPVMIAGDRVAGAKAIDVSQRRCDVIIMDDGLQNPALNKNLSISVIDARRGIGNGLVLPAGPLRATLSVQTVMTDIVVVNFGPSEGQKKTDLARIQAMLDDAGFRGPLIASRTIAMGNTGWLNGARVLAFAGIGNPERFFATLKGLGADIVERRVFNDHQFITESDACALNDIARSKNLALVTTEKDGVRLLSAGAEQKELKEKAVPIAIKLEFSDADAHTLCQHIDGVLSRGKSPEDQS